LGFCGHFVSFVEAHLVQRLAQFFFFSLNQKGPVFLSSALYSSCSLRFTNLRLSSFTVCFYIRSSIYVVNPMKMLTGLLMKTTDKVCTSIIISVNELKYSHGNTESGGHEFPGVTNKRCYSLEHHNRYYITFLSHHRTSQIKFATEKKTSSRTPLNVEREHLDKAI
jgi:hypothetical protein